MRLERQVAPGGSVRATVDGQEVAVTCRAEADQVAIIFGREITAQVLIALTLCE